MQGITKTHLKGKMMKFNFCLTHFNEFSRIFTSQREVVLSKADSMLSILNYRKLKFLDHQHTLSYLLQRKNKYREYHYRSLPCLLREACIEAAYRWLKKSSKDCVKGLNRRRDSKYHG